MIWGYPHFRKPPCIPSYSRLIARHLRAERAGTAAEEVAEELRRAGAAQWVDEMEEST